MIESSKTKLIHLVNRYKTDTHLLGKENLNTYQKELLLRRIDRHKKQIIDYVTTDDFITRLEKVSFI